MVPPGNKNHYRTEDTPLKDLADAKELSKLDLKSLNKKGTLLLTACLLSKNDLKVDSYFLLLKRPIPLRARRPMPKSESVAGSGTSSITYEASASCENGAKPSKLLLFLNSSLYRSK